MALVHIRQQGHSIHLFDGITKIRIDFDHVIVLIGVEDDKLLKFKGTSFNSQNFAYLDEHSGNWSSSLLWNVRFGHINYDSLIVMK